jgi:hypothetical protein
MTTAAVVGSRLSLPAFEFFFGPLNNSQYSLMTDFVGRTLDRPTKSVDDLLTESVIHLYKPQSVEIGRELANAFLELESAYVDARGAWPKGEFDFEPLKTEQPGPPIYLQGLSKPGLKTLRAELVKKSQFIGINSHSFRQTLEMDALKRSIFSMIREVDTLTGVEQ